MKIASILSIVALIASMATNGCSEDGPVTNPRQEEPQKVVKEEGFARGADVSWLTQMEAEGLKFYTPDENRQEMECMELLRDYCGVNSIRLLAPASFASWGIICSSLFWAVSSISRRCGYSFSLSNIWL